MKTPRRPRAESLTTLIAFSSAALPMAALATPMALFLPRFYASELGVPLAAISIVFTLVRLADMLFDPVAAVFIDQTRTRIGRYRPWMMAAVPVIVLATFMLFVPPDRVSRTYLGLWLLVLSVGMSAWALSQGAWAAAMSPDYNRRSRVYGGLQMATVFGQMLAVGVAIASTRANHDSQAAGVHAIAWFVAISLPLATALALLRTPEVLPPAGKGRSQLEWSDIRAIFNRPSAVRIMIADLFFGLGFGTTAAVFLFFFTSAKHYTNTEAQTMLLSTIIGGVIGAPITPLIARRLGKHLAFGVTVGGTIVALVATVLLPPGHLIAAGVLIFIANICGTGPIILTRSMIADVADEFRLDTGKDRTALLYSLVSTSAKLGAAFSVALPFAILDWTGFNPKTGALNGPLAVHGLEICFIGLPMLLLLAAIGTLLGYRLDSGRHGEIRAALDARDAEAALDPAAGPETLTGEQLGSQPAE